MTTPVYRNTLYYYIVSFLQSNDIISGTLANVMGYLFIIYEYLQRITGMHWHPVTKEKKIEI
jgi:hypothetical protein